MVRRLVLVVLALSAVMPAPAMAGTAGDHADSGTSGGSAAPTTTIDNSFLDTDRDLTECLNNSVELPGCGRAPTQQGDRGGALQLATFAILAVAIAFISWRVSKGVRARDSADAAAAGKAR